MVQISNLFPCFYFCFIFHEIHNLYFQLDALNVTWYKDVSQNLQKQYEEFVQKNFNMSVDGSKSLRINFADFLSYEISYKAMKFEMENLTKKPLLLPGLHYTIEQFFWISAVQRYCHVSKDQETIQKLVLSNFPIENFRTNNPLLNNEDFAKDFKCSVAKKHVETSQPLKIMSMPTTSSGKSLKQNLVFVCFAILSTIFFQ